LPRNSGASSFQILDRFVEARVKRTLREEKGVIARREKKPPE